MVSDRYAPEIRGKRAGDAPAAERVSELMFPFRPFSAAFHPRPLEGEASNVFGIDGQDGT